MSRFPTLVLYFILTLILSLGSFSPAFAGKKNNNSSGLKSTGNLKAVNNEGKTNIYGSVLDPNINQVLLLLPKSLLNVVRKAGLGKVSINLTSANDSTRTYTVPPQNISIQNRVVNKVPGKYLVVNFYNLTKTGGITVTPNSLPTDNYRLRLASKDLDITTDSFNYDTPILITGNVTESDNPGFVSVEDLDGNQISDKLVSINLNGTFLTEVRTNKIQPQNIERRNFKALTLKEGLGDTTNSNTQEDNNTLTTGVVHAVTDKDLYAVVPLNNDVETNTAKVDKPIEVNEASTLVANLGKKYKQLADEIAKDQLKGLEEEKPQEEKFTDFGCAISQFANRCDLKDDDVLDSIGEDFKQFVQNESCDFPEFGLLKSIVLLAPKDADVFIGKGYCEFSGRKEDEDKPCIVYQKVLNDFKSGLISKLPCPPEFCSEFRNIKPPRCEIETNFCEEHSEIASRACVPKPIRDLYCARIGKDIDASECEDDEFSGSFSPGWVIVENSIGNEFCVPSNISQPVGFNIEPMTPQKIAEDCEVNLCHKDCAEKFPFGSALPQYAVLSSSELSELGQKLQACHFGCDVEAGRVVDCGNLLSKYFSIKCCGQGVFGPVFYGQSTSNNFGGTGSPGRPIGLGNPGSFGGTAGFSSGRGPIPIPNDIKGCLCADQNNFNEKGFVKQDIQSTCKSSCPRGYEINSNGEGCLRICPKEFLRRPDGSCRRDCPGGFVDDGFGNCVCPQGQIKDPTTGQCVSGQCGSDQYLDPQGNCRCNSDSSIATSIGPEGCLKQNKCGSNMFPNNVPGEAQCICPSGLPYWDVSDGFGKCVAQCKNGNPSPASFANLPLKSPIPCTGTIFTRTCAAGELPSATNCSCASPGYTTGPNTACTCPPSYSTAYSSLGCGSPTTSNYCSPGITIGTNSCTCNPSGGVYNSSGYCTCPTNSGPYTKEYGCSSSQNICPPPYIKDPAFPNQCTCPQATPIEFGTTCVASCSNGLKEETIPGGPYNSTRRVCKCQDGTYPTGSGTCNTSTCPPATPFKCPNGTCATSSATCGTTSCPAPYITNPNGNPPCKCPDATPIENGSTCVLACPSPLTSQTGPAGQQTCKCPDGTYPNASGTCSTSTTNYCSPGITVGTNSCTCNPSSGGYNSGGYCTCPSGSSSPYTKETGCTSSTSRPCTAGEGPSNGCYCFGSGYTGSDGKCQCSGGVTYTGGGCGSTTQSCSFPYTTNPAYNSSNPGGVPPCICPNGKYYYNNDCVTICPNSLVTGTPSAGCGAGPIPSCLCPGTLQCPGSNGQCSSTTNYCSPGITVGTNSCTCNPSGGGYNSGGYCTCPSGSSTAYTAATGCSNTSTTNYCAPAVTAGTGSPPCVCASGATATGINGSCQCTNGAGYTAAGCGSTTTSHTCTRYEISSSSNPCTCASGATLGTDNICKCPIGQVYVIGGCQSASISLSDAALVDNNLRVNIVATGPDVSGGCYYLFKGQATSSIYNLCIQGINDIPLSTLSVAIGEQVKFCSSIDSTICSPLLVVRDGCTNGKTFNTSTKTCQCPAGQTDVNGICTTPQTIILNSAQISGSNLTINYSKSGFSECVLLVKGDDNSIILHNGVNAYGNYCNSDGGTITYPLNNYNNITNGYSVKLCKGNGTSTSTNTGLYYPNNCTAPISVTSPPRITLSNVTIKANDGTINFNFTKDTSDCFRLYSSNNTLLDIPNHCFGGGTTALYPFSALNTIPQVGLQYKICYFSEPTVCSNLVSATP